MDQIVKDYSPENLEQLFDAQFLLNHPLFSVLAKKTEMKWLVIVPKEELKQNYEYSSKLYGEIHRLADHIQENGFGGHFNLAKIGNKHPNYHIHLVFRDEQDEAWPDAIWCHEPLKPSEETSSKLDKICQNFITSNKS